MQTETVALPTGKRESKRRQRGVDEKLPGSGLWWIRYADTTGHIRREKAGTKSVALTLYPSAKPKSLKEKNCPKIFVEQMSHLKKSHAMRLSIPALRRCGRLIV
jgi:hypothetical protein